MPDIAVCRHGIPSDGVLLCRLCCQEELDRLRAENDKLREVSEMALITLDGVMLKAFESRRFVYRQGEITRAIGEIIIGIRGAQNLLNIGRNTITKGS